MPIFIEISTKSKERLIPSPPQLWPWLIIARALLLQGIRDPLNQARVSRVDRFMPKGLRCRDGGWEL